MFAAHAGINTTRKLIDYSTSIPSCGKHQSWLCLHRAAHVSVAIRFYASLSAVFFRFSSSLTETDGCCTIFMNQVAPNVVVVILSSCYNYRTSKKPPPEIHVILFTMRSEIVYNLAED